MNKFIEKVLLVILPPSNIGKSIIEIQNKVFSETGLYSAVCLPPIIPICYLIAGTSIETFNALISELKQCWEITGLDFVNYKNSIFLELSHLKNGVEVLSKIKAICIQEKEAILPTFPGFFICALQNQIDTANPDDVIKLISPPPKIKFKSFSLGLLKVSYNTANPWNEVYWEITEEKKLRKAK